MVRLWLEAGLNLRLRFLFQAKNAISKATVAQNNCTHQLPVVGLAEGHSLTTLKRNPSVVFGKKVSPIYFPSTNGVHTKY